MKEIKYEQKENLLITDCPYNNLEPIDQVKVSSIACENCEGFINDDTEKKIVKCKFDEILENKE